MKLLFPVSRRIFYFEGRIKKSYKRNLMADLNDMKFFVKKS